MESLEDLENNIAAAVKASNTDVIIKVLEYAKQPERVEVPWQTVWAKMMAEYVEARLISHRQRVRCDRGCCTDSEHSLRCSEYALKVTRVRLLKNQFRTAFLETATEEEARELKHIESRAGHPSYNHGFAMTAVPLNPKPARKTIPEIGGFTRVYFNPSP